MAMRSGAEEVDMVSLESRAQMPAWKGEVDEAEHEGIVVDNGWGPKEIVGEDGIVTGLKVRRCLSVFDENGRFNPAFSDEEKIIPCDSVILAIGQQADLSYISSEDGVQVTPRGILKIDEDLKTTAPGVFAGRRRSVWAARSGRSCCQRPSLGAFHSPLSQRQDREDCAQPFPHSARLEDAGWLSVYSAAEDAGAACKSPHRDC